MNFSIDFALQTFLLVYNALQVIKELENTLEESSDIDDVLVTSVTVDKSPSITLDGVADLSPDSKRYHAGIELAQCKAKLRRLRHELLVLILYSSLILQVADLNIYYS